MMNNFKFTIPDGINASLREMQRKQDEALRSIEEKNRKEEEWKRKVLEATEKTAENTSVLPDMLRLIKESNEKQDEVFEILVEMLSISKSRNKEEARIRFSNVMEKITKFKDNAETIEKLMGYAVLIWNNVDKML